MLKFLEYLKFTPLYELILPFQQKRELSAWIKRGKTPHTPNLIKQQMIKEYAKKYSLKILVETGTYLGVTIQGVSPFFKKIYTIELDDLLFKRAKKKFKRYNHIKVFKGDSAKILLSVIKKINLPTLFWLDAHYSKGITARGKLDTPIIDELTHILNHHIKNHAILIDDASNFVGKNGYPNMHSLKSLVASKNSNYKVSRKFSIIRIST